MYKEYFRTKGTGLTAGQLKHEVAKEFDEYFTETTFEDMDLDKPAIPQFGGFAFEENGYTVLYNEE